MIQSQLITPGDFGISKIYDVKGNTPVVIFEFEDDNNGKHCQFWINQTIQSLWESNEMDPNLDLLINYGRPSEAKGYTIGFSKKMRSSSLGIPDTTSENIIQRLFECIQCATSPNNNKETRVEIKKLPQDQLI